MKIKSLVMIAGMLAFAGISHAEEGKKPKKEVSTELLEKYDADKDGKLSIEELTVMEKARAKESTARKNHQKAKANKCHKKRKANKVHQKPKANKTPKKAKAAK